MLTLSAPGKGTVSMVDPARTFLSAARRAWSALVGSSADGSAKVIIHDPEAQGPKDLDDPFLDTKAQQRVGEFIAGATRAKHSD